METTKKPQNINASETIKLNTTVSGSDTFFVL